jgi:hypothetical protein
LEQKRKLLQKLHNRVAEDPQHEEAITKQFCKDHECRRAQLKQWREKLAECLQPGDKLPKKYRQARSKGAGPKHSAIPENGELDIALKKFFNFCRDTHAGVHDEDQKMPELPEPPPVKKAKTGMTAVIWSEDEEFEPQFIRYESLLEYIAQNFNDKYEAALPQKKDHDEAQREHLLQRLWYQRISRWCKRNNIVLRKVNRVHQADPCKTAADIKRMLEEVEEAVKADDLELKNFANLDETSIQIFNILMLTLDLRGRKAIQGPKKSKLALSTCVVWYGDGTMELVVCWSGKGKGPRWSCHNGILWFRGESKWSTKKRYHEVLRFFLPLDKDIRVFMDDYAGGHNGKAPDEFLKTLPRGVRRIRVPRNATSIAQPADRASTNYRLKALLRRTMRELRLKERLKKVRTTHDINNLSKTTREYVSEVLAKVREEFNSKAEYRAGIQQSFTETVFPGGKKHKALARFLSDYDNVPAAKPEAVGQFKCNKCGESWNSNCKGYRDHKSICFHEREELLPPLIERTEEAMNAAVTENLVANVTLGAEKKQFLLKFGRTWDTSSWQEVAGKWWRNTREVKFQKASPEVVANAKRHIPVEEQNKVLIERKRAKLMRRSKPELQEEYGRKAGKKAPTSWPKKKLTEKILELSDQV